MAVKAILPPMDKLLLRPTEAADLIGVGRSKIYELISKREIPSVRLGGSVRIPIDGLRDWIAAHVRLSETPQ